MSPHNEPELTTLGGDRVYEARCKPKSLAALVRAPAPCSPLAQTDIFMSFSGRKSYVWQVKYRQLYISSWMIVGDFMA